jgi:hypothetical protein
VSAEKIPLQNSVFMEDFFKKLRQTYPNKEPLTPELLKKFSGFENLSEENLQELVFSIQTLCELGYELFQKIQSQEGKKRGVEISPNFNTKQVA